MAKSFLVALTEDDMKDTLYAIALARVTCSEDIDRFRRIPADHPFSKVYANQLKKAEENRGKLRRLWEGFVALTRSEGHAEYGNISLEVQRDRS